MGCFFQPMSFTNKEIGKARHKIQCLSVNFLLTNKIGIDSEIRIGYYWLIIIIRRLVLVKIECPLLNKIYESIYTNQQSTTVAKINNIVLNDAVLNNIEKTLEGRRSDT